MFVVLPEDLVEWASPQHLALYCEIYLLEVRRKKYNLRQLASESALTYKQAIKLRSIAKLTLQKARGNNGK